MKRRQKPLPKTPRVYPSGIVVKTEAGYFLIRDNSRYRVPTGRVLDSWNFPLIVRTSEAAVSKYRIVAKIGFRDGTLIHNIADGKIYLISKNKRRHITSPEALDNLGVSPSDAIRVSDYEVNLQELGAPIG